MPSIKQCYMFFTIFVGRYKLNFNMKCKESTIYFYEFWAVIEVIFQCKRHIGRYLSQNNLFRERFSLPNYSHTKVTKELDTFAHTHFNQRKIKFFYRQTSQSKEEKALYCISGAVFSFFPKRLEIFLVKRHKELNPTLIALGYNLDF